MASPDNQAVCAALEAFMNQPPASGAAGATSGQHAAPLGELAGPACPNGGKAQSLPSALSSAAAERFYGPDHYNKENAEPPTSTAATTTTAAAAALKPSSSTSSAASTNGPFSTSLAGGGAKSPLDVGCAIVNPPSSAAPAPPQSLWALAHSARAASEPCSPDVESGIPLLPPSYMMGGFRGGNLDLTGTRDGSGSKGSLGHDKNEDDYARFDYLLKEQSLEPSELKVLFPQYSHLVEEEKAQKKSAAQGGDASDDSDFSLGFIPKKTSPENPWVEKEAMKMKKLGLDGLLFEEWQKYVASSRYQGEDPTTPVRTAQRVVEAVGPAAPHKAPKMAATATKGKAKRAPKQPRPTNEQKMAIVQQAYEDKPHLSTHGNTTKSYQAAAGKIEHLFPCGLSGPNFRKFLLELVHAERNNSASAPWQSGSAGDGESQELHAAVNLVIKDIDTADQRKAAATAADKNKRAKLLEQDVQVVDAALSGGVKKRAKTEETKKAKVSGQNMTTSLCGFLDARANEAKDRAEERSFERERWQHEKEILALEMEREKLKAARAAQNATDMSP